MLAAKLDIIARFCALRRVLFALTLLILTPLAAVSQTAISAGQAMQLAAAALQNGNPALTVGLTDALLDHHPDDVQLLLLNAAGHARLGNNDAAARAYARAFALSSKDSEKFQLARMAAAAQFRDRRFMQSEWWLRRAKNYAANDAESNVVAQEFAQVRRANPLSFNLNFSLAPNSNINNGSSSDTITIWNLPFILSADAQALSGYEASLGIDLRYKLSEHQSQVTDVGLSLFGRTFELSPEAKAAVPDARGRDYSYRVAELSLRHRRLIFPNTGATTFGALVGKNWYGDAALTKYERVTLSQDFSFGRSTNLTLTATGEHQTNLDELATKSITKGLDAGLGQRLGNGDILRFSLSTKNATSADEFAEYKSRKASIGYSFSKPVLGAKMGFTLGVERRDYEFSRYDIDGRHDETVSAGLSFVLEGVDYFGFSPSINIEGSRTLSNINLYDRESVGVRFGIQSNF